ncbi:cytochrome P450, partial [Streptomyces sp. NPDC003860]
MKPIHDFADADLFDDDHLDDPYPLYAKLREIGPAVYLDRHEFWAIPRFHDVREVLKNAELFISDGGIALNDFANAVILGGTVIASDGERHARLRRVLSQQLAPRAIGHLTDIEERAERLVEEHTRSGVLDAVALAKAMVSGTVMSLMGLPTDHDTLLLDGARATFDAFGPMNARYERALPLASAMVDYLKGRERVEEAGVPVGVGMG